MLSVTRVFSLLSRSPRGEEVNWARRIWRRTYSGQGDRNVAGGTVRAAARRHRRPRVEERGDQAHGRGDAGRRAEHDQERAGGRRRRHHGRDRSEEHTSELQSQSNLVCRLLLEKKKKKILKILTIYQKKLSKTN